MTLKRNFKRIALNITEQELDALDSHAAKDGRTRTDVLRELIRKLPSYKPDSSEQPPDKE